MRVLLMLALLFLSAYSNVISQTVDDTRTVLQMCLDLEELQPYFHPELEGRVPMGILKGDKVPHVTGLRKFGKRVEYWEKSYAFFHEKDQFLAFLFFEISEKKASTEFNYVAENVTVMISFRKKRNTWRIKKSRLRIT